MGSRFLARKEVEAKATNPEDRRTHAPRIAQFLANLATQPSRLASAAALSVHQAPTAACDVRPFVLLPSHRALLPEFPVAADSGGRLPSARRRYVLRAKVPDSSAKRDRLRLDPRVDIEINAATHCVGKGRSNDDDAVAPHQGEGLVSKSLGE